MDKSLHANPFGQIGNYYQNYIGVLELLSLKNGRKLSVEHHGDITIYDASGKIIKQIEVKHHDKDSPLSANSIDFLKTLYNWLNDYERYSFRSSPTTLILHTTQPLDNKLQIFSQLSLKEKKLELIEQHCTSTAKDNKKYIDALKDEKNKEKILSILNRFKILSLQPKLDTIKNKISEHSFFRRTKGENQDQQKIEAIDEIFSFIGKKLIYKSNTDWRWIIYENEIDRFLTKLQHELTSDEKITISSLDKLDSKSIAVNDDAQFIKKIKSIHLKDEKRHILTAAIAKESMISIINKKLRYKLMDYNGLNILDS